MPDGAWLLPPLATASRGCEDSPQKIARFRGEVDKMIGRWGDALREDPRYNPNLTMTGTVFDLAFPPRERACQ